MATLWSILVYGLLLGGVYAVMAFGLSLVYGVMRVVNLAHGAVLMIAAYGAYALNGAWQLDPLVSLPVLLPAGYAAGWLLYMTVLKRILAGPPMASMLLLFGVALCLRNLAYLIWTGDDRTLRIAYALTTLPLGVPVPLTKALVFVVALLAMAGMHVLVRRTHFGRALRAVTQDPIAAQLTGLNVQRVNAQAFGAGTALGVLGGVLLSTLYVINPELGGPFLLKSFCIIVLGGMESMAGIFAGALLLGVAETAAGVYVSAAMQDTVSFLLLVLVLIVMPGGLPAVARSVKARLKRGPVEPTREKEPA